VFLKGCPLRCPWCSNPESQDADPQPLYRYTACERCGTCAAACPNGAIALGEDGIRLDRAKCAVCGACVSACPSGALKITGETMTVDKVFKVIRKDAVYYETSGGGVTCSGGEILTQPDFVAAIFQRCREAGYHTCADTSGVGSEAALNKILDHTDLVYFDLKHMNPARHLELTGAPLETVLRSLEIVAARKIPVTLRVPLIPEHNGSEENLRAAARLARRLVPDAPVNLLPYHKYGESKYASVGMTYALAALRENTPEELLRAQEIFTAEGLVCEVSK
jgi:pyruvate formate lyase activating enzyme